MDSTLATFDPRTVTFTHPAFTEAAKTHDFVGLRPHFIALSKLTCLSLDFTC